MEESPFHILDLCSGTGCISLLLYSLLFQHIPRLQVVGIEIEPRAVSLAKRNLDMNINLGHLPGEARKDIHFREGDVLKPGDFGLKDCDILIANPPYISPLSFDRDTSRSTRVFEPKIALLPIVPGGTSLPDYEDPTSGDTLYSAIFEMALKLKAKIVLTEVADLDQAKRVLISTHGLITTEQLNMGYSYEIWHDELPLGRPHGLANDPVAMNRYRDIPFTKVGSGNARAVVLRAVEQVF